MLVCWKKNHTQSCILTTFYDLCMCPFLSTFCFQPLNLCHKCVCVCLRMCVSSYVCVCVCACKQLLVLAVSPLSSVPPRPQPCSGGLHYVRNTSLQKRGIETFLQNISKTLAAPASTPTFKPRTLAHIHIRLTSSVD